MPHILVRDVPDDVHLVLTERAAEAGQSLQQFLTRELVHLARTPTLADVLDRIETHTGGRVGTVEAVEALETARDAR